MSSPVFTAGFSAAPPTVFIVNVIHAHAGRQDEAFAIIQDVVRYVSERKPGFLWSSLAKSTDGQTVVNIEAAAGAATGARSYGGSAADRRPRGR